MRFIHRYFVAIAMLPLAAALVSAGCGSADANREKKARDESKRIFDAMHKDADAEIRKYTDSQMQGGHAARRDKKP